MGSAPMCLRKLVREIEKLSELVRLQHRSIDQNPTTSQLKYHLQRMSAQKATEVYLELNNGKKIPALGLGTANTGPKVKETIEAVQIAVKAGYRHIDTAWMYGTEEEIGIALKKLLEEGVVKREDLFITTKVGKYLTQNPEISLNESLQRLGLDYVDLLLQHWPYGSIPIYNEDGSLDLENCLQNERVYETDFITAYQKMEKIYKEQPEKVKSLGVSNYSPAFLERLLQVTEVKPVVNQVELHPHLPQRDIVEFGAKHNILITAYSPLGSQGAANIHLPLVKELCAKYNVTANSILTSYHIQEGRVVIPKSTNEQRIIDSTVLVPLTQEELQKLTEIGEKDPKRFVAPDIGKTLGFKNWDTTHTVMNF